MLRLVRDLVSPDLCKVGNLCSLEAEADISNAYLLVSEMLKLVRDLVSPDLCKVADISKAYLFVQEMLRLVRDLVSPDLCKVGNLCSLEAESPVSLSALPQEDIQCKFRS